MSGAVSFVLGLLGLGVAGGVEMKQGADRQKRAALYRQAFAARTADETNAELKKMHERVRKEWWSIPDAHPNCLGKWISQYPSNKGLCYQTKYWFKDHLDAKGIPYDEAILDEVSGVSDYKFSRMISEYEQNRRR